MRKLYRINTNKEQRAAIPSALATLRAGGILIFPTDTVYGIGGDALKPAVLRRLKDTKRRPRDKPFPWLVADLSMAKQLAHFSPSVEFLAQHVWPGATTLVLRRRGRKRAGIALRVPDHLWLRRLISAFGGPIIGTSANMSGRPPSRTARIAARSFPNVDMVFDGGSCSRPPSRVLDCTGRFPVVIRP